MALPLGMTVLACAAAVTGCRPSGDGEPWVSLGTGEAQYEPLADGQDLAFVSGPQGSHHLWIALRAGGIAPAEVQLRLAMQPAGEPRPRREARRVEDLTPVAGEPAYERLGWPAVLSSPECFVDRELCFELEVTDRRGRRAHDARTVVVRAGPDGPDEPCERE